MKNAVSKTLYSYWTQLRGTRMAPDRRDIEPSDIRHILGDTFILEVQDRNHYLFRLAGTRLCALFGRELKGRNLMSLWQETDLSAMSSLLAAVVEDGAAAVVGLTGTSDRGQTVAMELILLPLTHEGTQHSRIIGSIVPSEKRYWLGVQPIMSQTVTSLRIIWPDERPHFARGPRHAQAVLPSQQPATGMSGVDLRAKLFGGPSGPQIPVAPDRDTRWTQRHNDIDWSEAMPPHAVMGAQVRRVGHLTVIEGGRN